MGSEMCIRDREKGDEGARFQVEGSLVEEGEAGKGIAWERLGCFSPQRRRGLRVLVEGLFLSVLGS